MVKVASMSLRNPKVPPLPRDTVVLLPKPCTAALVANAPPVPVAPEAAEACIGAVNPGLETVSKSTPLPRFCRVFVLEVLVRGPPIVRVAELLTPMEVLAPAPHERVPVPVFRSLVPRNSNMPPEPPFAIEIGLFAGRVKAEPVVLSNWIVEPLRTRNVKVPVPKAAVLPMLKRVPAVAIVAPPLTLRPPMASPPEKVLLPERVTVPLAMFTVPVPLMSPEYE